MAKPKVRLLTFLPSNLLTISLSGPLQRRSGAVSKPRPVYSDVRRLPKEDSTGRINKSWIAWPAITMAIVAVVVVIGERYRIILDKELWSCADHVTIM